MTRERYAPEQPRSQCVFEHVYFSRPDSIVFGRPVQESRENLGRLLARECPGRCRHGGAGARFRRGRGHRLLRRIRPALPPGADPQSLRGPHVHRAVAGHPRFRRQAEAQSRAPSAARASAWFWWTIPSCAAPPAARSSAWCGRPARAKCICASPARPPFRPCFYGVDTPNTQRTDRRQPHRRRDPPLRGGRFARLSFARLAAQSGGRRPRTNTATPATPATIRPSWSTSKS